MALTRTTHFYEFLARLDTSVEAAPGAARATGMHLVELERISDGETVISERPLPPAVATFQALAHAMATDNIEAAIAAFQAELGTRE